MESSQLLSLCFDSIIACAQADTHFPALITRELTGPKENKPTLPWHLQQLHLYSRLIDLGVQHLAFPHILPFLISCWFWHNELPTDGLRMSGWRYLTHTAQRRIYNFAQWHCSKVLKSRRPVFARDHVAAHWATAAFVKLWSHFLAFIQHK